ncbi:hypothetical protein [Lysobacter fragariae]
MDIKRKRDAADATPLHAAFADPAGRELLGRINNRLIPDMTGVNAGRRRAIRSAQLIAGNRAVSAPDAALVSATITDWGRALDVVRAFAERLTPDAIRQVDALVAQVNDPTRMAGELLQLMVTTGMGFSPAEYKWMLNELQLASFEPLQLICDGDPRVLQAICRTAFAGDNGLLQVGFVDLGDDAEVNERVRGAFVRARRAGLTLSVFHLLPAMLLAAAELGLAADGHVSRAVRALSPRYELFREQAGTAG